MQRLKTLNSASPTSLAVRLALTLMCFVLGLSSSSAEAITKTKVIKGSPPACCKVAGADSAFAVCEFDPTRVTIQMNWRKADGQPYGSFAPLAGEIKKQKRELIFAANAGPFHSDLTPTGLYIENAKELNAVQPADATGVGNFYLKPNGVFGIIKGKPVLLTTEEYLQQKPAFDFASQSGPMLIVKSILNPSLDPKPNALKTRSAVCITAETAVSKEKVIFAMSDSVLTLYSMGVFLKSLNCANALTLDSTSSSFYMPSLKRADLWVPIGAMIAVVR